MCGVSAGPVLVPDQPGPGTVHCADSPYNAGPCQDRIAARCARCGDRTVWCCPNRAALDAILGRRYVCGACTAGGAA